MVYKRCAQSYILKENVGSRTAGTRVSVVSRSNGKATVKFDDGGVEKGVDETKFDREVLSPPVCLLDCLFHGLQLPVWMDIFSDVGLRFSW